MTIGQILYHPIHGKLTVVKKAYSAVKNAVIWYGVDEKGREHALDGTETEKAPVEQVSDMDKVIKAIRVKKGEKGDKGEMGPRGFKGEKGDKGDRGFKGDEGKKGIDGKDGSDGKDGKNGKIGPKGLDGKDGKDGKNGKDGKKGDKGEPGLNGLSGGGGIHEIRHATDVDYSPRTATNGQALVWDSAVQKWKPGSVSGGGAVDSVNGETGVVVLTTDDISDTAQTNKWATAGEKTKLGHISVTQAVDLDALEAASHAAVTVSDTAEIDLTLTGQQISATLVAGSIDETKLDTSVNASLDLADSALQSSAISDAAYDATGWNGDTTHAPSKNAVRDKIESLASGGISEELAIAYSVSL